MSARCLCSRIPTLSARFCMEVWSDSAKQSSPSACVLYDCTCVTHAVTGSDGAHARAPVDQLWVLSHMYRFAMANFVTMFKKGMNVADVYEEGEEEPGAFPGPSSPSPVLPHLALARLLLSTSSLLSHSRARLCVELSKAWVADAL